MVPAPITPTPHRFVTTKSTNSTSKPSSSLRYQHPPAQAPPSSQQFATTPRFSFGSSQKSTQRSSTPLTQFSSPLSRRPHLPTAIPVKNREVIEEASSDHEDISRDSIEPFEYGSPQNEHTIKRRRPNPPYEAISISSSPSPSPPSTPPIPTVERESPLLDSSPEQRAPPSYHPRFVVPTPHPSTTPIIPPRPPLILPPRSPTPPSSPPLFFSPHRRGQKYVPGGMAATVRDWVVEASQSAYSHGHGHKGKSEDVWDIKFRVGEVSGNLGMMLVRTSGGGKWILAGKGRGDGIVGIGCVVGMREPSWEVEVQGEAWRVGVEWKVLEG